MTKAEKIGKLLHRHIQQKTSSLEEKELNGWRQKSPYNEIIYKNAVDPEQLRLKMKRIYEGKGKVFQNLQERFPEIFKEQTIAKTAKIIKIGRIAAAAIILIGIGVYFFLNNAHSKNTIQPGTFNASLFSTDGTSTALDDFDRGFLAGSAGIIIEKNDNDELTYVAPNDSKASKEKFYTLRTPRGGEFILKLADGTRIWLNAETSISYPSNFLNDSANIFLTGEAYFEIAANSKTHITIIANHIPFKPAGLHFNLRAYPEEKSILSVISENNDIVAWKNGMTSYHNASIQTIMLAISRWYNVDVIYLKNISNRKFDLRLPRSASISDVINNLKRQHVILNIQGKTITVFYEGPKIE